uniref:ORF2 n=1 Tax=Tetrahymena thermophila TaxID=5911 RepID=Q6UE77_TETTH|nr:ORF2 [Tetrahymena thermophila]
MIRSNPIYRSSKKSQTQTSQTIKLDSRLISQINSHLNKHDSNLKSNSCSNQSKSSKRCINKDSIKKVNQHLGSNKISPPQKSPQQHLKSKIIGSLLTITGFNTQGVAKANKRNKQYSTLYLQKLFAESDATILLETNCKENMRVDIHNPDYIQMNNHCKIRQMGAGTASIHHKEIKLAPYVASLNNEKALAQVLILENQQRVLIMGLHLQLQANPIEEQALLEEIISQVLQDNRLNHILIYGDFNLDVSTPNSSHADARKTGQIRRLKDFLKSKNLYIHGTNRHTREAFKQNKIIKTQVDFFISSFAPNSILKIETITHDESNRGSDHYPIRIQIDLQVAKAREIKKVINLKQLDLLSQKLQKYIRSSPKNETEIRDKINSIKGKLDLKQQNSQQLRRNINERINAVIRAIHKHEKVLMIDQNPAKTRAEHMKTRRKIIQSKDTIIQHKVSEILKEYYAESTKKVQSLFKTNIKRYYQNIKRVCNLGSKSNVLNTSSGPVENSNKELLFDSKDIQNEISKYFKEHYKCEAHINYYHTIGQLSSSEIDTLIQSSETLYSSRNKAFSNDYIKDQCFFPPKYSEISNAMQSIPCSKTTKKQMILEKMLSQQQHRDTNLRTLLKDILTNPDSFRQTFNARQIYLLKSESRQIINCRPITIQSSAIKILENAMLQHVQKLKDEGKVKDFHISQCGFQKNRSTIINICRTIALIQSTVAKKENRVAIFVDVKSAFDSVNHEQLFQALRNQGFDDIFIKSVAFLYQHCRINGYQIGRGVIQGGKLSPILFNYLYEEVRVKILAIWKSKKLDHQDLHFELFADDMLIILKKYKLTATLLEVLKQAYSEINLQINESKTKIMLIGKQETYIKDSLRLRQAKDIDLVMEFKYLGLVITNVGKIHKDVAKKVEKAKILTQMLKRWRYNKLGIIPCLLLWQLFIKSQLQYASAIMITSAQSEKCMRSLRNMYNSSLRDTLGLSRNASIQTICAVLGIENIESMILNSYDNLMAQINADKRIQMQFRVFTKSVKSDIANRYQQLLQAATLRNGRVKQKFWWQLNNQYDDLIKLNIYLQNPSGQFCWKCQRFYKGDSWLYCQHKKEAWMVLQKILNTTSKTEIVSVLNQRNTNWQQLPLDVRTSIQEQARLLVYQDISKVR